MMTYALMGLLVFALAAITLWGVNYKPDKDSFMSIEDARFLRGFWCIIVVLVHIPAEYQNRIQDMIGSFAYIGVTFFFMTSAYGLKYSLEHKEGYMDHFWSRRLPSILVPALIANAFTVIMYRLYEGWDGFTVLSFVNINDWVKTLILYYLAFWIIYGVLPRVLSRGKWQDVAMCTMVITCSLVERFSSFHVNWGWIVEPLGFAYGIVAADNSESIKNTLSKNNLRKVIGSLLVSLLLGLLYVRFKQIAVFGDYLLKILLGIALIYLMFALIAKIKVGNPANTFLGNISYEIYLIHTGVFALILLCQRILNERCSSEMFILSSIVLTLLSAKLLERCSKEIILMLKKGRK